MKQVILILLTILFIYSCEDDELHSFRCKTDEDCTERISNNYVCDISLCRYDFCKSLNGNEACGEGRCKNKENGYSCFCPQGMYKKTFNYTSEKFDIDNCITDISCEKASDCDSLGRAGVFYSVCSATENKCVSHCSNDFDCKGDYARCSNE